MRNLRFHENRERATQRLNATYKTRHQVFVQLRQKFSNWTEMAQASGFLVSYLQNLLSGRQKLTEGTCHRLEAGLGVPGVFGLSKHPKIFWDSLPVRIRHALADLPEEQWTDEFRRQRLFDFLNHHPSNGVQNQEYYLGALLGFPGGSTLYGITRKGRRVTEETVTVIESHPGYEGWFDPERCHDWALPNHPMMAPASMSKRRPQDETGVEPGQLEETA